MYAMIASSILSPPTRTERDDGDLGRAAADVDDHVPGRLGDREPGADRGGHRLLDQEDLARAGGLGGLLDGALLDLGDAEGHADDDAGLHQRAAVVRARDEVAEHRLGDLEVGDDAVAQGAHRLDVARGSAEHLLGFFADREHLLPAAVVALHGDDARLAGDDALALHVDERGGGPEVDREIVREEAVEPVENHRMVPPLWPAGRSLRDRCANPMNLRRIWPH
jgi:hypothetical protein